MRPTRLGKQLRPGDPAVVVGGANSAGQASLSLRGRTARLSCGARGRRAEPPVAYASSRQKSALQFKNKTKMILPIGGKHAVGDACRCSALVPWMSIR